MSLDIVLALYVCSDVQIAVIARHDMMKPESFLKNYSKNAIAAMQITHVQLHSTLVTERNSTNL